jgi:hypothetical protein
MRHFLRMLELAKIWIPSKERQDFFSYAENAQVFVFPSLFREKDISSLQHEIEHLKSGLDTCLECSECKRKRVQAINQNLDKIRDLQSQDMSLLKKVKTDEVKFDAPFSIMAIESMDDDIFGHLCVLAAEISPNNWKYWWSKSKEIDGNHKEFVSSQEDDIHIKIFWALVDRINHQSVGTEKVRHRAKIGSGKDKKTITIRQITYVYPQQERPTHAPSGREIDWSHRWFVRGHWRKANGIGKNREGIYCVPDWTWVSEHIKGTGNIVKKVHVITS